MERERNAIEERLNSSKHLDELDDDESFLKGLNEEDQAIINDIYALEFDKEAANERMAARNEELSLLRAQIVERKAAIWCDGDSHLSGRGHHNRGCCWEKHQRFEKTWKKFGRWS